jgi:hypothetical protein
MSLRDTRQKEAELTQYRDLVIATLDYYLDNSQLWPGIPGSDGSAYFEKLKTQTEVHFQNGRLTMLKQWFRDLTEMPIETRDLKFNKYLQDKTGYEIDIFKAFFQRIDKVIDKGKISTDNQFYDIRIMADHLCQNDPVDEEKVVLLNRLLQEYEQRKSRKGI